jgi:dimethylglycine dehydrogenase
MKSHAQVVVIGGGVVGCSVLYHLTKLGCTDVVLCERKELTAGSSWHAAGGFHAFNSDPGVARLQAYTISIYPELQALSGQDIGIHRTGGLLVAETPERWDFLRSDWARHKVLGLETELVSPAQVRDLCPIMDTSRVLGALYAPDEGHLDPYGATHAYAKAARLKGADIYRHTRVLEITPTKTGGWRVSTDKGSIDCEHVVNAAGLWAREVGRMVNVELPAVPMEHHYLITEDIPELAQSTREMPGILDLDGEIYLRQERKGMLLGVYEKDATPWAVGGVPWEHGETELLPPNLDRLVDSLHKGFQRFPALANAGIRRIVNGPFTFTPDGNPLVGPVPGLRNYWAACGVMAGFSQGGGVGLALAQWIINGEPDGDILAMDVARFGPYAADTAYSVAKAREFYGRRFQIAYPNECWPAGRPCKTSAVHATLAAANAVFGVSYGLEIPQYFAPSGTPAIEVPTLRRSNAFASVGAECHAARNTAGILDISSFSKFEIIGPGAANALDRLLAGRLPALGRVRLTPMLAASGRLMGDLTTMRLAEDHFQIGGSGYLQAWHMRWFDEHLVGDGVRCRNVSDEFGGLALMGPKSRELLARLTAQDVGDRALPFMAVARMTMASVPAVVARLSVTGELGYEIYVARTQLPLLLEQVLAHSQIVGARHIGLYALNSLRLEKGFGIWSREFSRDYTPRMAGLDRFVDYAKTDFIGRDAALRDREVIPNQRLVTLAVDSPQADAAGYEPIWSGSRMVGFVTSGGYGHCAGMSLAMGYLHTEVPDDQRGLSVTILGERCDCRVLKQAAIDPGGARMRG